MGQKTYSLETLTDGTQVARAYCWKCGGKGYLPGYEFIDNARCWGCGGHKGPLGQISVEEFTKREARNAKARERRQAARVAKAEARRAERNAEFTTWKAEHAADVEALLGYTGTSNFVLDAQREVKDGWEISDSRMTAVAKIVAEQQAATAVPAGRQQVTGTVRSTKWVENAYGGTLKMLVDCGSFRVYGTMPASLSVTAGDVVTFTATLEPGREVGFGFFSRPAKATLVTEAAA